MISTDTTKKNNFSNTEESPINNLPDETLQDIFSFAVSNNPTNLLSIRLSCKKWEILSDDSYLIKHLYKSYFVSSPTLPEEKNEKLLLDLLKDLIQNINAIIIECRQIDSCKDLMENLSIDNLSPKITHELSELRDLYNLEILYSAIEDDDEKNQKGYGMLSNGEKLIFIRERLQEKKEKVSALELSNKKLTSLPQEICLFPYLQYLNLDNNLLVNLPPEISQLKRLRYLHLSRNQLTSLPSEICILSMLEELNFYNNKLTSLPTKIDKLNNLKCLKLSENQLSSLPHEIRALSSLEQLYLNKNKLVSLPEEISQLRNLEYLHLSENLLENLPSEIHTLSALKELFLDNNKLTSLPSEISQLYNLRLLKPIEKPTKKAASRNTTPF